MSTRFKNSGMKELVSDPKCTYLKTPAGLCTEVTLPIEEMYQAHKNDTLNSISVSFQKLKDQSNNPFKMGTPSNLLMVRKGEMKDFFENNKVYDNKTTFIATYSSTTNSYDFSKLNRLISYIFSEIRPEKGEAEWNKWKSEHQDYNKLLLVPVTTESDSQGNIIGVENDLNVNSAMLMGGKDLNNSSDESQRIRMSIIYTNPVQK